MRGNRTALTNMNTTSWVYITCYWYEPCVGKLKNCLHKTVLEKVFKF